MHYGFNCGSGSSLIVSENSYHDGKWHKVVFSRMHTIGKLVIDDEIAGEGSSKGATKAMNVEVPYYIGGIPPDLAVNVRTNIKVRIEWNLN